MGTQNPAPLSWLIRGWRRLRFRWRRDQLVEELADEIEFHREQKQAENLRHGLPLKPASDLSRRQMGNVTAAMEECRDMWSFTSWERLLQDLRHALRMYGRTPAFTGICILSIALGIGGSAAMFSLVNALLIRPLPYSQPDRLVRITGIYPRAAIPFFQDKSRAMEIAAVSAGSEINLTGQGTATRLTASTATPNFLTVLGSQVAIGRSFRRGEESPGRDHVVLISNTLWKERFGGAADTVGRVIRMDGVDREIVGILPSGFSYPSAKVQMWIPMRLDPSNFLEFWGSEFVPLIGRLQQGATLSGARTEVRTLSDQFRGKYPYPMPRDFNADSTAVPLQQDIVGDVRPRLLILLCSVVAMLLIACANVSSLLLSRATTRRRELALRTALGAGRMRIVRQLLTESIGLAATGALLGIILGISALDIFKSVLPSSLPGLANVTMDWQVVAAVSAMALAAGLASGLAPALSASQVDITSTIRSGSQRSTTGFWTWLRGALIVGEVALTLVLLICAGLLLRSVYKLSLTNPGFTSADVQTIQISPNQSSCVNRDSCVALYSRLLQQAGEVAGVRGTAVANSIPLDGRVPTVPVDVEGHPKTAENPAPMLWLEAVSPSYFQLMQIPLIAGRFLTDADGTNSARVLVIPAATAKRFWPRESALGKHIKLTGSNTWATVVGVVGDVKHFTLDRAFPAGVAGVMYVPYSQSDRGDGQIPGTMTLLVKAGPDSGRAVAAIEQLAKAHDPNVPVGRAQAMDELLYGSIAEIRSTMLVFASFAVVAIILAAVGIYGLMSYWVGQRMYEIGLRVAVGCSRQGILALILGHGMRLTLYGVVGGILGSLLLTRFIATQLYGVAVTDVPTFASVTGLVFGVALLAAAVPAWRATRIDPVQALRAD